MAGFGFKIDTNDVEEASERESLIESNVDEEVEDTIIKSNNNPAIDDNEESITNNPLPSGGGISQGVLNFQKFLKVDDESDNGENEGFDGDSVITTINDSETNDESTNKNVVNHNLKDSENSEKSIIDDSLVIDDRPSFEDVEEASMVLHTIDVEVEENPFLDDDDDEVAVSDSVEKEFKNVANTPSLNPREEKNKKIRDVKRKNRKDFFAKRDQKELEPQGFLRRDVVDEAPLLEVLDESGGAKWLIKDTGRVSQDEIEIFKNLNKRKGEVLEDLELRNLLVGKTVESKKSKQVLNRAIYGNETLVRGSRKRFTDKDRDVLKFLALFKYSNARHISHIFQVTERAVLKRLRVLRDSGLIIEKKLYGTKPIWYLTEAGMVLSGMELPRVTEQTITYTMLPHQFVVNHVASNLWGGGVNVLNLSDFPVENRLDRDGQAVVGEELVSELQLQSALSSVKLTNKAETYRPLMKEQADQLFGEWEENNFNGESPERIEGNEHLWVVLPPASLRKAYHVPDLVVSRKHNADGSPESIAVEVELANKTYESYEKVLNSYRSDDRIYKMVIWVVKSSGAARKIEEAALKLDMWDDGRVDVVPIFTEDGVFNGTNEWVI